MDRGTEDGSSKRQNSSLQNGNSEIGLVEVQKLEYGTRTLQKSVRLIVNDAPDVIELERISNSSSTDPSIKAELEQNKLLHLASQLKTKYKLGQLKIFDDIAESHVEISDEEKTKLEAISELPEDKMQIDIPYLTPSALVLSHTGLDGTMPPLPVIKDPHLYERVFIHKSTINLKSYLQQHELINLHNERLEFLGDSILNNLATLIIYDRFPGASEGDLTKIRSHLIDNKTLKEFSFEYGLNKKLRTNINEEILKLSDQKIYADIFEAYVGALGIERGLDFAEIKDWLAKLYEKKLSEFDIEYDIQPLNKEAKTELYSVLGTAQFHPTYHVISKGDGTNQPFEIECKMGNDVLGFGTASNMKDAGLRAAMTALNNKPMLEKYHKLRMATDRKESVKLTKKVKVPEEEPAKPKLVMVNSSIFPVKGNEDDPLDSDAKNRLYAEIGKRIGEVPQYEIASINNGVAVVELKIKGVTVATATDKSKKRAMTRAAMALVNNREALEELCK
ncbi:ribonuclease III [Suhomyces tanzawaensis NRRL Y-17324]|uniref:ribonuclease III n=1 Tax=Suhomyces tanzawaensis NRRL Y-17324 TaxID=984487 RepID=A0A1E4SCR0_9ASCO|nr:ribonuclease III [Suhomyces tanzawaensis NRRL Y-17324]ODV77248.1 ribonuclease III [Suhomyces tanzawaensis NRRL Y-17324]